ncbi:hypothetical protein [Bacillus alkalicellulosilyticus]|uniref:hypothetical protein n=1 Tax=Alkalihalobacterium alkalicellulosilyticum TaxID=1912214 RepID=UPI000996DA77|nr:hypothetical protein [Bacillus alkalicellulosilyticus]
MSLVFLIGVVSGMLIYRLILCRYIQMDNWGPKLLCYVVIPLVLTVIYSVFMKSAFVILEANFHLLLGFIVGLISQFFIVIIRLSYYEELLSYYMRRNEKKD